MSRAALDRVAEGLALRTRSNSLKMLADAGIKAVITDALFPPPTDRTMRYSANPQLADFLAGKWQAPDGWHAVFNLPYFHEIRLHEFVDWVSELANVDITSLGEYEEALFELIKRARRAAWSH